MIPRAADAGETVTYAAGGFGKLKYMLIWRLFGRKGQACPYRTPDTPLGESSMVPARGLTYCAPSPI